MRTFLILLIVVMITTLSIMSRPVQAQGPTPTPTVLTTPAIGARGPYAVGEGSLTFVDDSRDHRKLLTELWYPAIPPANPDEDLAAQLAKGHRGWPNAAPDTAGKPYPLILYSHALGGSFTELAAHIEPLVSHGFVVAAVYHRNSFSQATLVDRPLDILFVLDQLAALKTGDLAGLIDTDHTGVMGWSDGAYTALALTGARVDPASASTWGATPLVPGDPTDPRSNYVDWNWDKLVAYRASLSPLKPGEMWPPFTDKRILGALLLAPCNTPLFGARGLAAATVPTLMVAGPADFDCPYDHDAAFAYAHLGSHDRYLLTLVDATHMAVGNPTFWPVFHQFEAAFFGYYLQGHQDDDQYLSADYVTRLAAQTNLKLAWGPYSKKS